MLDACRVCSVMSIRPSPSISIIPFAPFHFTNHSQSTQPTSLFPAQLQVHTSRSHLSVDRLHTHTHTHSLTHTHTHSLTHGTEVAALAINTRQDVPATVTVSMKELGLQVCVCGDGGGGVCVCVFVCACVRACGVCVIS